MLVGERAGWSVRYSGRGHALVFQSTVTYPVLTVEVYCKWYDLFIVHPSGRIEGVPFPDEGKHGVSGPPYVDHVPNPRHVVHWARREGVTVDDLSLEIMIGRWELEVGDRYQDLGTD